MKKLFLGIFIIVMCFVVTGCSSKSNGKLLIKCNGEESTIEAKTNAKFKCKMAGEEFELKITKIENKKITIKANKPGLSKVTDKGTISLVDKQTKFVLEESKELELSPQVTDNFEILIINWEK